MNKSLNLSLLTDFYELTMMQGYFFKSPDRGAVFDYFYRNQPYDGGYTIYAGLDPLLDVLEGLKFGEEEIDYLHSRKIFRKEFLDFLADFSFRGDVYSIEEGSVAFPNEPLLRIHGTIMETQLVESVVLNSLNFQSLVATKASRITDTAGSQPVMEFGLRRAQGIDGSLSASRAAYIGGVSATSNVLAGKKYNIPVSGTMAHSWVMSFGSELESFEAYAELYPENSVLLVDTFDTLESGVPNAIKVFKKLKESKPGMMAVRIDSGDLEYLSKETRGLLDKNGLTDVKIIVSSDLDEWIIRQLKESSSPIDAWGVGTKLISGGSEPALPGVYKMTAIVNGDDVKPCIKISNQSDKITNPGIKNIFRFYNINGMALSDLIYLEDEEEELNLKIKNRVPLHFSHPSSEYSGFLLEDYQNVEKLLHCVMSDGRRLNPVREIKELREFRQKEVKSLDITYRRLLNAHKYKVSLSDDLKKMKSDRIRDIKKGY